MFIEREIDFAKFQNFYGNVPTKDKQRTTCRLCSRLCDSQPHYLVLQCSVGSDYLLLCYRKMLPIFFLQFTAVVLFVVNR